MWSHGPESSLDRCSHYYQFLQGSVHDPVEWEGYTVQYGVRSMMSGRSNPLLIQSHSMELFFPRPKSPVLVTRSYHIFLFKPATIPITEMREKLYVVGGTRQYNLRLWRKCQQKRAVCETMIKRCEERGNLNLQIKKGDIGSRASQRNMSKQNLTRKDYHPCL